MNISRFLILLGLTIFMLSIIMYGLSLNSKMAYYIDVAYYAIPAFSVLSMVVFVITDRLEKQVDKQGLLNVVISNTMMKFLVSAMVIGFYYYKKEPSDGIFVVPFIIVYVAFTIFETYYMSEQARVK